MRAGLVAITALVCACHHDAPPQVSAPAIAQTPAARDAAAPSPHAKDSGSCAAIAQARTVSDAGVGDGPLENCLTTKNGAWGALVVSSSSALVPSLMYPQIELQFVHAAGETVAVGDRESWINIEGLSLFDFDGDGEEELVVHGARSCRGSMDGQCSPRPEYAILAFHSGKVAPLPALSPTLIPAGLIHAHIFLIDPTHFDETDRTLHIDDMTDVDGDGRPDLQTSLYYDFGVSDGDVSTTTLEGPTFVAHSLPDGTFSVADAVAMKTLAANCAGLAPFEKGRSEDLFAIAVCARLRGKGVAEISQRYTTRCLQIRAKYKQIMKDAAAGKPMPDDFDGGAEDTCRTEPEAAWSEVNGIPKAIVKMLQQTQPLLAPNASANATPPKP